jgi:hypothetical protein
MKGGFMDASVILGLTAGSVHLVSYALYNREMLRGNIRPNTATWVLWTFLALLNTASYVAMSQDLAKAATPIAGCAACVVTLCLTAGKGRLSRLNRLDMVILAIGSAAGLLWWSSRSAACANLLLQLAFVISNIPTFRGVWKDPCIERPLPWFGFAAAYLLNLAVVIMRWNDNLADLAYPVISLIADGGVGIVIVWRRRRLARCRSISG